MNICAQVGYSIRIDTTTPNDESMDLSEAVTDCCTTTTTTTTSACTCYILSSIPGGVFIGSTEFDYIDCFTDEPASITVFTETPLEICAKTGSVEKGAGDPGLIMVSESNCCITTTTTTTTTSSARTPIPIYQNSSEVTACDTSGLSIDVYMNTPLFSTCTILYANLTGPALAAAGWYTDVSIYRYWDGSNFGVSGFCE
jgi:hypothetical protein